MTVKLYLNLSEPHRVNKNLNLIAELEGNLRDGSSVINPSVLIDSETNLSLVNYIEIEEFGRKYFVNNVSVPDSITKYARSTCGKYILLASQSGFYLLDALTADIRLQNTDLVICVAVTCGRVVKNKVSHTFSPFIYTKGILS